MKTELEAIIFNLKECFDGKPWYGMALITKLDALDWTQVNEKEYGSKSIAILVQHIINWRIFVIKKLQGDAVYDLVIDTESDWTTIHIADQNEWNQLLRTLRNSQEELLSLLATSTDGLLQEKVPGKNYDFGPILISIPQHDIYHLGQIAMLSSHKGS